MLPFAFYNLLLPFGLLCMLPGALVKMRRRGGRWQDLTQRIGWLSCETQAVIEALPREKGRLWMHAVSVGEVNVARKLIKSLLIASPDTAVVLTTTTKPRAAHALPIPEYSVPGDAKPCKKTTVGHPPDRGRIAALVPAATAG